MAQSQVLLGIAVFFYFPHSIKGSKQPTISPSPTFRLPPERHQAAHGKALGAVPVIMSRKDVS